MIVKANDDVRQEAFTMQIIELCAQVWDGEGLPLWVKPYRIVATGPSTGAIECVRDCTSIDAMKER